MTAIAKKSVLIIAISALCVAAGVDVCFPDTVKIREDPDPASVLEVISKAPVIERGRSYLGALEATDFDFVGPTDYYRFLGNQGEGLDLTILSSDFDPVVGVMFLSDTGNKSAQWGIEVDDTNGDKNPHLVETLPETGEYLILVYNYSGNRGRYQVKVGERSTPKIAVDDRWERVGSNAKFELYYDKKSIVRSGSNVTVWTRMNFKEVQTSESGAAGRFDVSLARQVFDCSAQRVRSISMTTKLGDETVDTVEFPESLQRWTSVLPGSFAEGLLEVLCGAE